MGEETRQVHIVWNADRSEGVVFDNMADAREAQTGRHGNPYSTLADEFFRLYGDDDARHLETVAIPVTNHD